MWGAIAGAAMSGISSLVGGSKAKRYANRAEEELEKRKTDNDLWYNRRYNEDATQTAEAQNILRQANETAKAAMAKARGAQAVMGGTEESVAGTRDANAKLLGNTVAKIAASGTARKDAIESQYLQNKNAISQQFQKLYSGQAANATDATSQATKAGMGLVGADMESKLQSGKGLFANLFKKKKDDEEA